MWMQLNEPRELSTPNNPTVDGRNRTQSFSVARCEIFDIQPNIELSLWMSQRMRGQ